MRRMQSDAQRNTEAKTLIFINAGYTFAVGMFAPFYAVYVAKIGGGAALAGVSWAIFSIVSGLLILLLSKWELHVRKRHVLLAVGYLIRAAAFVSYAFMYTVPQLLVTQILWGIGSALGTPAFDALYASSISEKEAIAQWGDWEGLSAIATGIAALAGGFLIQWVGFTPLFLIMAGLATVLGVSILYKRHRIKQGLKA